MYLFGTWNIYYGKESDDHGQMHDFPNHYWSFFKFKAKRKAKELASKYEAVWLGKESFFSLHGSFERIR